MSEYITDESIITNDKGEIVANGVFEAVKHIKVQSKTKEIHKIVVRFTIVSGKEKNDIIEEIPLADLKNSKLLKHIPDCFIFYTGTKEFNERFLRNKILQDIKDMPIEAVYALEQGHNEADGNHIFCIGDCIVNPVDNTRLKYIPLPDKILKTYTVEDSYMYWINKFCGLDKDTMPALLLSVASAIIIPLLKEAGIDNMFVVYIYGETGKGKSTYTRLLTEVYSNTKNYLTLSSDITGIREMMVQTKDFVMLADDLNLSGSARIKASKESKISEIIQQAANGDLVKYKGEESYFEGVLFVTAEYVLKNKSTNNRCLLLHLEEEMDKATTSYLKENQGLYIKFVKDFARYVYNSYGQNVKRIKNFAAVTSAEENYCKETYAGITRIERTEKILMVALDMLLDFFKTELSLSYNAINKYSSIFRNSVKNCIDTTKEYVRKESTNTGTEYIDGIISMVNDSIQYEYNIKYTYIAKSYKSYNKEKHRRKNIYFFVDNGCICFRGDDIVDYFKNLDGFEYSVSKKALSSQLNYYGLLKARGGEYSFPCHAANNKTRYYHIYIENLAHFMYPDKDDEYIRRKFINELMD